MVAATDHTLSQLHLPVGAPSLREARTELSRRAPDMVGRVDIAILRGESMDAIERTLILAGCGREAVAAARRYVELQRPE